MLMLHRAKHFNQYTTNMLNNFDTLIKLADEFIVNVVISEDKSFWSINTLCEDLNAQLSDLDPSIISNFIFAYLRRQSMSFPVLKPLLKNN